MKGSEFFFDTSIPFWWYKKPSYNNYSSLTSLEAGTMMELARRLADWRDHSPERWFSTICQYLPPAVTAVLVVTIAYQLATFTWILVPGHAPIAAPVARAATGNAAHAADLNSVADSHLFGEADEQVVPVVTEVINAPETTLNLTLKGTVAIDRGGDGSAIISSNRGDDKTYQVGQSLEGADGTTLHSVYGDRVLLNRSGQIETLRYPKDLVAPASLGMPAALPQAAAPEGSLREVISENATRLADIVGLAPHVQEGQVIGFRVNPGRDRATFDALGLRAGDVVTDINGTVLHDLSQGLQVFQSLGETTQATVTVLRDGVPQVIVIDTGQLQRPLQNRE